MTPIAFLHSKPAIFLTSFPIFHFIFLTLSSYTYSSSTTLCLTTVFRLSRSLYILFSPRCAVGVPFRSGEYKSWFQVNTSSLYTISNSGKLAIQAFWARSSSLYVLLLFRLISYSILPRVIKSWASTQAGAINPNTHTINHFFIPQSVYIFFVKFQVKDNSQY